MTLLRRLPYAVIAAPERILVMFAVIMIGIGLVLNADSSSLSQVPRLLLYEVALAFVLGGVLSLIGIGRRTRAIERLGVGLTGFASWSWMLTILWKFGRVGATTAIIMFCLGLACLIRIVVSSAAARVLLVARQHEYECMIRRREGDCEEEA